MAQIESKVHDFLKKIAKERNFQDLKVTPITTGGANYSSLLYTATFSSKGKDDLHLFVKAAVMSDTMRGQVPHKVFDIEQFVYTDLKNSYRHMEEKHRVPEEHRLYIPEYYGANTTPMGEMLALENLVAKGFTTHHRLESMNWQYASAAATELAKLLALSVAFQKEYPDLFKHFSDDYLRSWLNESTLKMVWGPGISRALSALKEENKDKFKKYFDAADYSMIKRQFTPSKIKVLAHGDYRVSNLMHRTREDGSLEIIVVDHQTIQIGCPVTDLMYLIFTGTDKPFRDQYFDKLIDHYYTQLSEAMKRLDIDPETTYSRADFDFEMKEKLPLGLSIAAFTLPIVTVETEDAPDLNDDLDLSSFAVRKTGALFPDRINGVVDDYVKWGILKD